MAHKVFSSRSSHDPLRPDDGWAADLDVPKDSKVFKTPYVFYTALVSCRCHHVRYGDEIRCIGIDRCTCSTHCEMCGACPYCTKQQADKNGEMGDEPLDFTDTDPEASDPFPEESCACFHIQQGEDMVCSSSSMPCRCTLACPYCASCSFCNPGTEDKDLLEPPFGRDPAFTLTEYLEAMIYDADHLLDTLCLVDETLAGILDQPAQAYPALEPIPTVHHILDAFATLNQVAQQIQSRLEEPR